jgi:prolyl-tRNA editing enzyme YbaK/EbsC (Cys-tRNA(Pro) deacylase)/SAM-dependent methyltransferase
MSSINDADYLRESQYKDSRNLDARIAIHTRYSTSSVGGWNSIFDHYVAGFPPAARILEIGCGTGLMWLRTQERIAPGWQITLTDFSAGMVEETRRNLSGAGLIERVTLQQADAQDLPFPDASFDIVIANMMLYHVPDRPKAFGEIKRVLTENGRLYAVTVGSNHLKEIHQLAHAFERESGLTIGQWGRDLGTDGFFTIESGEHELRTHFGPVEIHHFRSNLHVTDVEPLVDYLLSTSPDPVNHRAPLTEFVTREMATRQGVIAIQKHTALLITTKPRASVSGISVSVIDTRTSQIFENRLKEFIDRNHIQAEHLAFTQSTHSVDEAAQAVGATPQDFVKSVCLITKAGDIVVGVVKGEDRVDRGAVQRLLDLSKLSIASPADMLAKTGYPAGGTPPFGFTAIFVIDERVFENPVVYAGGGSEQSLIRITPTELKRANGAEVAVIRQLT